MTDDKLKKMRMCSLLLPDPGGEVVRELLDEVERLQEVVQQCREDYFEEVENGRLTAREIKEYQAETERIIGGSEGA